MARLARVVAVGVAHHVTQRGNRRQQVFFNDQDYAAYCALLAEGCRAAAVAVWSYCLMPNHVHLILVPSDERGLRAALAEAHRRYSRRVNFREGWRGYLWQGRFASVPMDGAHTLAAARYVELNPVRAGLARGGGLAVVERARPPGRARRRSGAGAAPAGAGAGLVGLPWRRRARGAAGRRTHRPPIGIGRLHRRPGADPRPDARPPQAGTEARPRRKLGIVSPE